jgi:hypothetical protein
MISSFSRFKVREVPVRPPVAKRRNLISSAAGWENVNPFNQSRRDATSLNFFANRFRRDQMLQLPPPVQFIYESS